MIVASISTFPVDKGISLSRYVRKAIDALEETGLVVDIGPMCTTIEAPDLDTLFDAVKRAHNAIADQGSMRILTTIKIDDRRDVEHTAERKLRAVGRWNE
ncbi:MAG TPA: MTH1187 family thiamine-binding protein [Thermoplasmata archaeon]|nr:MTH1187 family thiamine-binding protein [Thermoplasmata archaeon]